MFNKHTIDCILTEFQLKTTKTFILTEDLNRYYS